MFDKAAEQQAAGLFIVGRVFEGLQHLVVGRAYALGVNDRIDDHRERPLHGVEVQVNGGDLAKIHAHELHGRINGQATQRLVESEAQAACNAIGWRQGGFFIGEQHEIGFLRRRLVVDDMFGGAKRQATNQY
ncbi:hypothetical protein D3C84_895500 [compost metagenome]